MAMALPAHKLREALDVHVSLPPNELPLFLKWEGKFYLSFRVHRPASRGIRPVLLKLANDNLFNSNLLSVQS